MGCSFGKGHLSNGRKESVDNTKDGPKVLPDIPTPAAPDPRLPLTAKQRFNISKSWKGIARAMEPTGVNMFVKLFQDNQDLLTLFEKFQYLRTKESQRESMELAQHASVVMATLDEAITSLDNIDYFIDYLYSVGKLHRKVPGFQRDYFWRIEKPFLAAVQDTLGDRYTDNMENIYKITIHFILETVIQGFDIAGDSETMAPAQSSTTQSNPTKNETSGDKGDSAPSASNPPAVVQNNV